MLNEDLHNMESDNQDKRENLDQIKKDLEDIDNETDEELKTQLNLVQDDLADKHRLLDVLESEISHLEDPIDKVLTCVSRMNNQLRNDGKAAELTKDDLCRRLNEVSLKATSLFDQLYLSQTDLHDSMIIEDQVKINEKDVELDFNEHEEYDEEEDKTFKIKGYKNVTDEIIKKEEELLKAKNKNKKNTIKN